MMYALTRNCYFILYIVCLEDAKINSFCPDAQVVFDLKVENKIYTQSKKSYLSGLFMHTCAKKHQPSRKSRCCRLK